MGWYLWIKIWDDIVKNDLEGTFYFDLLIIVDTCWYYGMLIDINWLNLDDFGESVEA